MNKKSIIIVAPGGGATGGVELLHQLSDLLNQNSFMSSILVFPFTKTFSINSAYKKYFVKTISLSEIDYKNSIFVIPETFTHLINKFGKERSIVWWMSVDNFINSGKFIYAIKNKFLPWNYHSIEKNKGTYKSLLANLYQSEYAKRFLNQNEINENVYPLSDYINQEYIDSSKDIDISKKENIILFNPAKGFKTTKLVIEKFKSKFKFIPIINLSRTEIISLMMRSKIYIDFGNHPGKDRIPRETCIFGCIVVTNTKGSAFNNIDIPIDKYYKIENDDALFLNRIETVLTDCINNYESHIAQFEKYRAKIINEKKEFFRDALEVFNLICKSDD